jgi:hypothetical protein
MKRHQLIAKGVVPIWMFLGVVAAFQRLLRYENALAVCVKLQCARGVKLQRGALRKCGGGRGRGQRIPSVPRTEREYPLDRHVVGNDR